MSKYDFYKGIDIVDNKVSITEFTNNTEILPGSEFEFFNKVKTNSFNVSKGVGSSVVEINVENKFDFFNKIKLDEDGNIKIKYK